MNLIMLDNFDSFTYNLVDQFRCMGHQVIVYRNDICCDYLTDKLLNTNSVVLVLSPGPGTPKSAGNMMKILAKVAGRIPILGICLGHQALVEHYGGVVDRAADVMHGKASKLTHNEHPVFANLANPLSVARYHSLIAKVVPDCLEVIAHFEQLPMAICHTDRMAIGYQFHPESILTANGSQLLSNTLNYFKTNKTT